MKLSIEKNDIHNSYEIKFPIGNITYSCFCNENKSIKDIIELYMECVKDYQGLK